MFCYGPHILITWLVQDLGNGKVCDSEAPLDSLAEAPIADGSDHDDGGGVEHKLQTCPIL